MNCYSCDGFILKPIKLEAGLPARACNKCRGVHLDLLSYRSWREENTNEIEKSATVDLVEASDNKKALVCQRCSKIMLKYKVSTDHENYIDLCTSCDDVWLDGGEWSLLKHLQIHGKLTEITTEPWQRHLREETAAMNFDDHYIKILDNEGYSKLKEITQWIRTHKLKDEILKYIRIKIGN